MSDASSALDLIKQVGIGALADFDGCLCGSFAVKGIEVYIACRKSSGSVGFRGSTLRVWDRSLDHDVLALEPIAREIARQLHELDPWPSIRTRFCDYLHDHPAKCVYCDKSRTYLTGYLCAEHQADADIQSRYDARHIDFVEFGEQHETA